MKTQWIRGFTSLSYDRVSGKSCTVFHVETSPAGSLNAIIRFFLQEFAYFGISFSPQVGLSSRSPTAFTSFSLLDRRHSPLEPMGNPPFLRPPESLRNLPFDLQSLG